MADSTISQLPAATVVNGTDLVPIDQGGVTKKATLAQLGNGTVIITTGKTLYVSNTLTLTGTDGTSVAFPSTNAIIARTDAGQTFTGTQIFLSVISGSINGNAATATALQTGRAINGVNFDGSAAITVPVNNADDTTTNASVYPLWTTTLGGNYPAKVSSTKLYFNPFTGNLTANIIGNVTGSSGICTGNAATATALQNPRTIDGTSFDGTANITVIAPAIHAAPSKATPVDADELGIWDSVGVVLNKLTWANLKTTLGSTFAALAGSASQVFSVAAAAAVANVVRADQPKSNICNVTATVAANALTMTLKAGSVLDFRSTTMTTGVPNTRFVPADISLVISSGSTLGTTSAVQSRIMMIAIDNAGTVELAAVNVTGGNNLDETTLISTTAEGGGGGADSASVFYSTTARSNVPFRVVGYVESTQTTAGTWAQTPTTVQGRSGTPFFPMRGISTATFSCGTSGTITLNASSNTISWSFDGHTVTFSGHFDVSSVSSPVGTLAIVTGIPFISANNNRNQAAVAIRLGNFVGSAGITWQANVIKNSNNVNVDYYGASTGSVGTSGATLMKATTFIEIAGSYTVY